MSKGPVAQFLMLFGLIAIVVTVVGIIVALLDQDINITSEMNTAEDQVLLQVAEEYRKTWDRKIT